MALYQRMTSEGADKIGVHRFGSALRQWAWGKVTRAQVIAAFDLEGTDVTELDALAAAYAAQPTDLTKTQFLLGMEDVFLLCETGDYSEAQAKAALGF